MNNRYSSLNGLRSLAAIGIVLMHIKANLDFIPPSNFIYTRIIPSFNSFVYLFFVVSAFSMCCGYYTKIKMGNISMNDFYRRRYMRILPFFALLVLIDIIVPHGLNKHESASIIIQDIIDRGSFTCQLYEAFADLTLCFNLLPNPDIKVIGVAWYLGLVFLFYMLFPFFVFMMDNKTRAWKSLILSLIFCYIAINYFYTQHFINFSVTRHNMIYSAPFFITGGILYLYKDYMSNYLKDRYRVLLPIMWIGVVVLWILRPQNILYVLLNAFLCAVCITYAINSSGSFLSNKLTHYISNISMEVYLCHMMAFRCVEIFHVSRFIHQPDMYYLTTCVMTLSIAVAFSHVVKFKLLPLIEPYIFKK